MTTDEIETALAERTLPCRYAAPGKAVKTCQSYPEKCSPCYWRPAVAAFIAEREAGLRKALAEQMDNTIAHQRRADVALDWNRLAVKQRDELQAKYDEAFNVARMNGTERDTLRAQLADRDRELELLRSTVADVIAAIHPANGPTDALEIARYAINRYRAAQADKRGEGET